MINGGDEALAPTNDRRATKTAEERRRIVAALFPEKSESAHWWFRFSVMLALSVVIAVMGLSMNSGAVVIGAMLIAPMMAPVLGISASLTMGWFRRLRTSMLAVALGLIGSVAISWLLTSLMPTSDRTLTPEVLSRTSPDVRDLIVALAAGAAGAYATSRDDVSSSLPGVAVAVALIPPLSVVGFSASIGRFDLARGALLLFAVNLVAIVLVGAIVFVASGFVPAVLMRRGTVRMRVSLSLVALSLVALMVPLTLTSIRHADQAHLTQAVNQTVTNWLMVSPTLTIVGVSVYGADVKVQLSGPVKPPPTGQLVTLLRAVVGPKVGVSVQWYRTQ